MSWQQQSRQSGGQMNPQSQLDGQMPRLPQQTGLAVPQPQSGQSGALSSGQDGLMMMLKVLVKIGFI